MIELSLLIIIVGSLTLLAIYKLAKKTKNKIVRILLLIPSVIIFYLVVYKMFSLVLGMYFPHSSFARCAYLSPEVCETKPGCSIMFIDGMDFATEACVETIVL